MGELLVAIDRMLLRKIIDDMVGITIYERWLGLSWFANRVKPRSRLKGRFRIR